MALLVSATCFLSAHRPLSVCHCAEEFVGYAGTLLMSLGVTGVTGLFFLLSLFFEIGSCYTALAGLELTTKTRPASKSEIYLSLPLPPKCWD